MTWLLHPGNTKTSSKKINSTHWAIKKETLTILLLFISLGMTDLRSIVAEPVVSLSEVIKDDATAITATGWQNNWGRGVGFTGHPGRVEGVCNEEEGHDHDHPTGNLEEIYNTGCYLFQAQKWFRKNKMFVKIKRSDSKRRKRLLTDEWERTNNVNPASDGLQVGYWGQNVMAHIWNQRTVIVEKLHSLFVVNSTQKQTICDNGIRKT